LIHKNENEIKSVDNETINYDMIELNESLMDNVDELKKQISDFYQKKRDLFASQFAGSQWKVLPSAGSFFQCLDYSAISTEKDVDLADRLTREIKVASIPVSVFYETDPGDKILRFCFAKEDEVLIEAAKRLIQIL
jgi:methionine aminotransferase